MVHITSLVENPCVTPVGLAEKVSANHYPALLLRSSPNDLRVGVGMIINGTSRPLSLYDGATGSIYTFAPVPRHQRRVALASLACSAVIVLDATYIQYFENVGGCVNGYACVKTTGIGRRDAECPYVIWGDSGFHVESRPSFTPVTVASLVSAANADVRIQLYDAAPDLALRPRSVASRPGALCPAG